MWRHMQTSVKNEKVQQINGVHQNEWKIILSFIHVKR
jgi:hypothetical protein